MADRHLTNSGPAPELISADADLLLLGAEFGRRNAIQTATSEEDEGWLAAYERTSQIVTEIATTPAHSIEGLCVKARAFAWCRAAEDDGDEEVTTDLRLAVDIVRGLLEQSIAFEKAA